MVEKDAHRAWKASARADSGACEGDGDGRDDAEIEWPRERCRSALPAAGAAREERAVAGREGDGCWKRHRRAAEKLCCRSLMLLLLAETERRDTEVELVLLALPGENAELLDTSIRADDGRDGVPNEERAEEAPSLLLGRGWSSPNRLSGGMPDADGRRGGDALPGCCCCCGAGRSGSTSTSTAWPWPWPWPSS